MMPEKHYIKIKVFSHFWNTVKEMKVCTEIGNWLHTLEAAKAHYALSAAYLGVRYCSVVNVNVNLLLIIRNVSPTLLSIN